MSKIVLVTGINGFIAKHVALSLLQRGYKVRGTVRSSTHAADVKNAMQQHGANISDLQILEADLTSDAGWIEAVNGCDFIQHVASPFPIEQPKDRESLVPQAKQGAIRILEAARHTSVKRAVVTSSMVAMMYRANRPSEILVQEEDWTDPEWENLSAYIVSKTRAEKAIWKWVRKNDWESKLTVVNPGFVLGPSLDSRTNTSLNVIQLIMEGAYPAVPGISFPTVDVRDLAELHVVAMESEKSAGRRLIAAAETITMAEMAVILRAEFPDLAKKIPTAVLPGFFVRFLSIFDRTLKSVTPDLGVSPYADNAYVTALTGVSFRPAEEAVRAAGRSLVEHQIVGN